MRVPMWSVLLLNHLSFALAIGLVASHPASSAQRDSPPRAPSSKATNNAQQEDEEVPFEDTQDAFQWDLVLDFRLARTDDATSWLDAGLGKTRYGADSGGRAGWLGRVAQTSLVLGANLGDSISTHVHLNVALEPGNQASERPGDPIALVEGFLVGTLPLPGATTLSTKAGIFFPPISLEHPGTAWTTVFTITPSAINSWVGEEVRTSGVELSWTKEGLSQEARLVGAAFLNNDPTAALLAYRGFSLHDRQTAWRDKLPLAPIPSIEPSGLFEEQASYTRPVDELDDRVGFYAGTFWENYQWFQLGGLYYDNRGKPDLLVDGQYAWRTRFLNFGANVFLGDSAELLFQWMKGDSEMGFRDGGGQVLIDFDSAYILATKAHGRNRFTFRYDWFRISDDDLFRLEDDNTENGWSLTFAYLVELNERLRLAAEWLHVDSNRPARGGLDLPSESVESLFQLSLRLTL